MTSRDPTLRVCNSRLRKKSNGLEKIDPGPWGGKGYCKLRAGWGADGTGRCKFHGGLSLKGEEAPSWVDGSRSRYRYHLKPETVNEIFVRSREDPDWLALVDDAALLSTRIQLLLDELEGPPPDLRQLAGRLMNADQYLQENQPADARDQLRRAIEMCEESVAYHRVWSEVGMFVEQRRRIVESGSKQLVQMQAMLKIDDIMELLRLVSDTVQQACDLFITDPDARRDVMTHVSTKLLTTAAAEEQRANADAVALAAME